MEFLSGMDMRIFYSVLRGLKTVEQPYGLASIRRRTG